MLGKSLSHSFSKSYFTEKFRSSNLDTYFYENFEIESIDQFLELCKDDSISGFNVTIPYKESLLPYLDELSTEAQAIGAVNTLLIKAGRKIGHNTDAFGFQQMIKPFLLNTHEKALILGNGGAAKAVRYVLKNIGLDVFTVARTPKINEFHWHELNENMVKFCGVIVQTTPVGMYPESQVCLDFPFSGLTDGHLVVDLIYNPEQTLFLERAKLQGATTLNGLTMLHQQAEKSWEIWNQKE